MRVPCPLTGLSHNSRYIVHTSQPSGSHSVVYRRRRGLCRGGNAERYRFTL